MECGLVGRPVLEAICMTFDVVWITHTKNELGRDEYRAFAEFDGRTGTRFFTDKEELVETMREILKTQTFAFPSPDELLEKIESGSLQFFGANALDLTTEQAKLLGWT